MALDNMNEEKMMGETFSVAILGVGARGGNTYGRMMYSMPDKFKIVSLCDKRADRLEIYGELFGVPECERFKSEESFFEARRADALIISTYDKDHARQAVRAMELGYTVLLEKPAACTEEELCALIEAQKKYEGRVMLCHVLRYAPIFKKLIELCGSGAVGDVRTVAAEEPVSFWHMAHSFVRGNARGGEASAGMLLAKCCHDLDIISAIAGEASSVSSIGGVDHFKAECAPEGAAKRCTDCKYIDSCPYSAKRIYIDDWHKDGEPENSWPTSALATAPITEEKLYAAIREGQFGRCVYYSDNDAVDNQFLQASFKSGIRATLSMTGFNAIGGRRYLIGGTTGSLELIGDRLTLSRFGEAPEVIEVAELTSAASAHGGGDLAMIEALYLLLLSGDVPESALEISVNGYRLGMAAEHSRELGGERVAVG